MDKMTVRDKLITELGEEKAEEIMDRYLIGRCEQVGFRWSRAQVNGLIRKAKQGGTNGTE